MPAIEHKALNAAAVPLELDETDSKSSGNDLLVSTEEKGGDSALTTANAPAQEGDIFDLIGWNGTSNGSATNVEKPSANGANIFDLNDLLGGGIFGLKV